MSQVYTLGMAVTAVSVTDGAVEQSLVYYMIYSALHPCYPRPGFVLQQEVTQDVNLNISAKILIFYRFTLNRQTRSYDDSFGHSHNTLAETAKEDKKLL